MEKAHSYAVSSYRASFNFQERNGYKMAELVYITEDDESIRELIKMALSNFSYEVKAFENAEDALDSANSVVPALFIFDIMLPGMNGIEAVKELRSKTKTAAVPILMLTAKDTEMDKVVGLDAGADDYLAKPFGIMELAARIRALLRRNIVKSDILTCGNITVNTSTREALKNDDIIELTYKEFELLKLLVINNGRVISRDELLNTVWGYDFMGETRTLDAHIKQLRGKLGDDAENQIYIKTVRNVGYRFCEG